MANVQPFDFNPGAGGSTSVKTGSYTIATGKYAIVTAECFNGGTLLFDAAVTLKASAESVTAVLQNGAGTYTVPAGLIFHGNILGSGTGLSVSIGGGAATTIATGTIFPIAAGPGQAIVLAVSSGNIVLSGYSRTPASNVPVTATFFGVKAGTAITVTGDTRYTVTEYAAVS